MVKISQLKIVALSLFLFEYQLSVQTNIHPVAQTARKNMQ